MNVRTGDGVLLPLVITPVQAAPLVGKGLDTVRADCEAGLMPTMPRARNPRAHWRIPTIRLLELLGIPFELVSTDEALAS
jgi:hypothetical protein